MAGRGTRLRPHTITVPKPLVKVAGKSIVHRLVEDLTQSSDEPIDEIAFIIGDFGNEVEEYLTQLANDLGAKASIYHQDQKLGTAHALLCAQNSLEGNLIVAFADTLFRSDFKLDASQDGILWVQQVEDPRAYGVVTLNDEGTVTEFVEKPTEFVSDLAIIGIYYFKDGKQLKDDLQYLIDNDIKDKGEYQLTNALENLKNKGKKFKVQKIDEWLDCGNQNALIHANERVLSFKEETNVVHSDAQIINSVIIKPCYIEQGVCIKDAVIGPYVTIHHNATIEQSVIRNSIINDHAHVIDSVLNQSMIGSHSFCDGTAKSLSLGDYSGMKD